MQSEIAKTAFLTSVISYGVFLLFEYLRPGFVQNVFSVHWFLVLIIATGIWYSFISQKQECRCRVWQAAHLLIGLLLMIILWREGEVFGDFRIFMAIAGLILPMAVARLLRSN